MLKLIKESFHLKKIDTKTLSVYWEQGNYHFSLASYLCTIPVITGLSFLLTRVNLFQLKVAIHMETSHLICTAGFYMM